MKTIIKSTLAALALSCSTSAIAQQFSSSYFMEGSLHRHELNPAFAPEQNYVGFPLLGSTTLGVNGNFGLKDIFFNRGGKTVTFLHPDVSLDDVMSGLKDRNKLLFNFQTSILSGGFHSWGGYNTVGLNLRAIGGMQVGKDFFELAKDLQNKDYNIDKVGMQVLSFAELAFGHSRQLNDNLRLGAKVKFLFGLGRSNVELNNLQLHLSDANQWTATADARAEINVNGLVIKEANKSYNDDSRNTMVDTRTGERYGYKAVDNVDFDKPGLGGFGLAFDLGGEYDFKDLVPGLKASLSLIDLGFISWNTTHLIQNNGQTFVFDGFNNIQIKDGNGKKMGDQMDELKDKLEDLYRLENKGDQGSTTTGIGATLNIGVEYALPMYDKIRFGLLSTTRFQGDYTWNEERLSVNYAPCNWFDMNINGGIGTFGASFGWMLNVHPTGFNLFIGMDHLLGKVAKPFIPLRSNADFTVGINFPFGRKK